MAPRGQATEVLHPECGTWPGSREGLLNEQTGVLDDLLVRTSDSGSCGQGQLECTSWWILSEALGAPRGCAIAGACCGGG